MLSKSDFKAADQETVRIMLWVAGQEKQGWLSKEDIDTFPCRDLRTINQLWLNSSNGKFGFSVQKQIWIECGGYGKSDSKTMKKFEERVEWKYRRRSWWKGDSLVDYIHDDLCWDLRARNGHLPYIRAITTRTYESYSKYYYMGYPVGKETVRDIYTGFFFSRAATCKLQYIDS